MFLFVPLSGRARITHTLLVTPHDTRTILNFLLRETFCPLTGNPVVLSLIGDELLSNACNQRILCNNSCEFLSASHLSDRDLARQGEIV